LVDEWTLTAPILPLRFTSDSYTVLEGTPGFATIKVLNVGGAPDSGRFLTADGSAVSGNRLLRHQWQLNFQAAQTETNFTVMSSTPGGEHQQDGLLFLHTFPLRRSGEPSADADDPGDDASSIKAGNSISGTFVTAGLLPGQNEEFFDFDSCNNVVQVLQRPFRPGAIHTVVRTNAPPAGVVDYETADGRHGIPFLDYLPVPQLVFDASK